MDTLEDRIKQTIDRLKYTEKDIDHQITVLNEKKNFIIVERHNFELMLENWEDDKSKL